MSDQPDPSPRLSPAHGAGSPPGLDAGAAGAGGRFGRMFPALPACDLDEDGIEVLLQIIDVAGTLGYNPRIPSGFTYLGQFIDHDITFEPSSHLDKLNDPSALVNFRSPRLDLDSVYGSGPSDQPFLYNWDRDPAYPLDDGVKFLIAHRGSEQDTFEDLPRNDQHRALIGDPRNDVHLIITQLHLLFLRFHNAVVDLLRADGERDLTGQALFAEACRIVRWHFQWIVVHDFLPRIVGKRTMKRVLQPDDAWPRVERRFFRWERDPFIPVEFSGAVYRFGHSMVRDTYRMRPLPREGVPGSPFAVEPGKAELFPKHVALVIGPAVAPDAGAAADEPVVERRHLTGFRELPRELVIDWSRFFAVDPDARPQSSLTLDTGIAIRLFLLPEGVGRNPSLPRLNLLRGRALGLPSGQDVARAMGERELGPTELFPDGFPSQIDPGWHARLSRSTPLWYYILAEAATDDGEGGLHLGPVGGRLVAEVLLGIIEGDPQSYLNRAPAWIPELRGADAGQFTMVDLIHVAHGSPQAAPPG